jgi:putative membrane protein insertion efficiency factor
MTETPRLSWPARLAVRAIRWYQTTISSRTPPVCRFTPTCSQYALQAIERYGVWRGTWMGFVRILRCNPLTPGGHDPVPGTEPTVHESTGNG